MTILSFCEFKKNKEEQEARELEKRIQLSKLTGTLIERSDITNFNHDFYKLVDMFAREKHPTLFAQFDKWLEDINK